MLELLTPRFARLTDYAGMWGITPDGAALLTATLAGQDLVAHVRAELTRQREARSPMVASTIELVPAGGDKRVAVVKALGPLMKGQSSLGGTSTIQLRRDIQNAARDPSVSAILLAVESPGGTIAGTPELAAEVRAARKRKPVWAQIEDMGASAAYWPASQADAVFANHPSAAVGNVGTIQVITDVSKAMEADGVRVHVFTTGPLKAAGWKGTALTDEQAAMFQAMVEECQTHFDAAVKAGRGLSAEQMKEVRTGAIFTATRAKELRLIDGIRPIEATLAELIRAK